MSQPHTHFEGCNCAEEAKEQGQLDSLYPAIDLGNIRAMNEREVGQGRNPFKSHDNRLDNSLVLQSDEVWTIIYILIR